GSRPGTGGAVTLDDRDWMVICRMDSYQACFAQCRNDSIASDGEDSGASSEAVDQQMCSGLRRGDDVRGTRRDAKLDQMIRDRSGRAGSVVGEEADLGATIMKLRNGFDGARHGYRTQIDDAVEIEQDRVVGVDHRYGCPHSRLSPPGSPPSCLPASSA